MSRVSQMIPLELDPCPDVMAHCSSTKVHVDCLEFNVRRFSPVRVRRRPHPQRDDVDNTVLLNGTRESTTVQAKTTVVSEPARPCVELARVRTAQGNRVYTVAGRHTQHELERAILLVHTTKNSVQAYHIQFGKMCAYITALFWSK